MATSFSNQAVAMMRDTMDKALAAPDGVRLSALDAAHSGNRELSLSHIKRLRGYCYTARSQMRRVQARSMRGEDVSLIAAQGRGDDPDAFRTSYDTLYFGIDRNPADDGWWLTIRKVDATALGLEIL